MGLKTVIFGLVLIQTALKIVATPIILEEISFEDDWDFRITPHSEPLLGEVKNHHILPRMAKLIEDKPQSDEPVSKKINRSPKKLGDAVRSRVSCPVCKLGVGLLVKEVEKDASFEEMKIKFVGLCTAFKVAIESVCTGIFDVYGPQVLPVVKAAKIGPEEVCSLVLGETCGDTVNPKHDWQIEFSNQTKPQLSDPELPQEGLPTFKILQISDTHYDPDYVVGSPSNCQEPLCCRSESTPDESENLIEAGKWGAYQNCDSPKILLENMLRHIAEEHPDIDFIIWTGDIPPHDIWNQSKTSNLDIIQDTVEMIFDVFPRTPIFPALGNHESLPAGNFAPPWMKHEEHSISWLYTKVADHWRKWLPASSGHTVLRGGFYSVLLRPGFRVIAINTNYCHTLSWWLLVNSTDPAKELQWLTYELQLAEDKGEKVHIIGHIPPGSYDCMKVWSRNFYSIVERYENTIQAQFYGHSHADEFEIFYDDLDNSRPTNIAYLGPSVTTYDNFNPAYRIYYVDGDHANTTREVLDHETWTFNLEDANTNGEPKWYRLYSARNEYEMESLRPKEWDRVLQKLINNPEEFEKYYKLYYRDSVSKPVCDNKCKLQLLCDLRSGKSHHRHQLCHDLEIAFGS